MAAFRNGSNQDKSAIQRWIMAQTVSTTLKVCKNWLGLVTNCPFLQNVGILGKLLGVRGIFCLVAIPDTDATEGRYEFPRSEFARTGHWVLYWQIG